MAEFKVCACIIDIGTISTSASSIQGLKIKNHIVETFASMTAETCDR